MRFKSKMDGWYKAVVWLTILIIIATLIFLPKEEYPIGFGVGIPMVGLLLWTYFGSYFELREDYLLCRMGPFTQKIYYEKVTSAKIGEGIPMSMALSKENVEIIQSGKGSIWGTTYISPMRREAFMAEFLKRCPKLR
ncbi:MAG TPA: PH domain-containing protein [Oscillospiraceae bacterium]|nr:PH domain-containing protein [Oscillospiraceae bacterium]HPK35739.1 PH domain-containing protein [Oscillospiraceae bacterium]HPR75053.1 PH domain-containing protein [Oscillospiraceae bacterium]